LSACYFPEGTRAVTSLYGYGFKWRPFCIRTVPRGAVECTEKPVGRKLKIRLEMESAGKNKEIGETAAAVVVEASADPELKPSQREPMPSLTSLSHQLRTRRPIQIWFIIVRQVEYKTIWCPSAFSRHSPSTQRREMGPSFTMERLLRRDKCPYQLRYPRLYWTTFIMVQHRSKSCKCSSAPSTRR
jgi:hypothetical protein